MSDKDERFSEWLDARSGWYVPVMISTILGGACLYLGGGVLIGIATHGWGLIAYPFIIPAMAWAKYRSERKRPS